ncbi:lipid-A-disaccharide synthase [Limnobacter litoralis]|uniref:Lipid-A-disaccharide synthase n=1 Tax=Limnobacter litoralis TaxID=481366 RepID=A0ABQ5YR85_9BURK|nr:lipid-A-disaccharide synthase [Limnobacter litoralis]GLR26320.1 lipid-A-disaccharide synthase [Limnobacter litoralis]
MKSTDATMMDPYPSSQSDIALCVGEASGDWIAALAIEELLYSSRALDIEGIAGPKLRALGVRPLHQSEELSVRGYVEVLRHLPRLLKMRKNLMNHWAVHSKPKVFVGVDAPDFNLKLEHHLREHNVPTVHLVCPSIWAWRMERIHTIKAACSQVLCVFPFEPEILEQSGIRASYIGHPMASIIPDAYEPKTYREKLGLSSHAPLLAVLPGSRGAEIKHIGPAFVQACVEMKRHKPDLEFVTPLQPGPWKSKFESWIPAALKHCWRVVEGHSHECMAAANAVMLASGTATLEAMMWRKPMVIAYKMPWLSYRMMKDKGYMPYIGLPNILLQEFAVPELIQHQATPQALANKALFQLDNEANRQRLERKFAEQHRLLRRPSGQLAAQALQEYLI